MVACHDEFCLFSCRSPLRGLGLSQKLKNSEDDQFLKELKNSSISWTITNADYAEQNGSLFFIPARNYSTNSYLTVRTEEVRMVNQDVAEDSRHFTKVATVNNKHCHYYLFDRLPHTLKKSAAVQEYLAVEIGLRKSYILVGSRLPRGGWESWIDKRKCLESVIKLPRGGRGTRRPDQQPITHAKTCSNSM